MPIEIAGISLSKIHRIATREKADFVRHRIPGLEGNIVQDMGRESVQLMIEGIFYGETALDDLEGLRKVYKDRQPVDFLADLVGQAYFSQVILERFEVWESASEPGQLSYSLQVAEYVEPPEPDSGDLGLPEVDTAIELEALDFMDMIQLPDLLSIPDFGDPTPPLAAVLDGIKGSLDGLTESAGVLSELFADE